MENPHSSVSLFRVVIPVSDLAKGVSFYSELFGTKGTQVSPGRHYFFCGAVTLCVYDSIADGDATVVGPNPTPVYFETSELILLHERAKVATGRADLAPIATRPWGETSFYIDDPFGNPMCFVDSKSVFSGQFYVE